MSDLPWTTGDDPPTRNGAKGRGKCRHHQFGFDDTCHLCGTPLDPAVSRRSKNNTKRGNAKERAWCIRLGLDHVGQFKGIADGQNALFVGQCKTRQTGSFPGWMSDELDKLALLGTGKTPILGVVEAPGPGRRERRLVVMDEADWIALHVGTRE